MALSIHVASMYFTVYNIARFWLRFDQAKSYTILWLLAFTLPLPTTIDQRHQRPPVLEPDYHFRRKASRH